MKKFCCSSLTFILILLSALFLSGENLAESTLTNQDNQKAIPLTWLSLLLGKKTVSDIIKKVDTNDYASEAEIATDEHGRQIALTKMMIVFKSDATPSQFYRLLDRLSAVITCSAAGTRSVVVRIPKPANLAAYYSLIDTIEAEPFVDFVWEGDIVQFARLPSNYQNDPVDINELSYIDHHLAIRAHAAWNASKAIDSTYLPYVVVLDGFGDGPPILSTINATIRNPGVFRDNELESGHGYGVLGVIAGSHEYYYPTGIYPNQIYLHALDEPENRMETISAATRLLNHLVATPGKKILNTSWAFNCTGTGGHCVDITKLRKLASWWVETIQKANFENLILHVSAASSILPIPGYTGPVIRDASSSSLGNAAALLTGLTDDKGNSLTNLTNTLVVENATNWLSGIDSPATVKCLHEESFVGGHLSGIGTEVTSFNHSNGGETSWTGTSFSTPQVVGLAAFIWAIDDTLTPQQIIGILKATADPVPVFSLLPGCSDWNTPAPIVDAYEALLALDEADTPSVSNSPVRFAVLDVNEDGSFDEDDLQLLVNTYYDTSGADPVLIDPFAPDYGRYDLNGDGWTGGSSATAFDLDRVGSGSIQYGMPNITNDVTQNIEGTAVSFNENTVRDSDILCYYAYSNLYSGGHIERQNLLEGVCHDQDQPDECTYTSGTYSWGKTCFDEDTGIVTGYFHSAVPGYDGKIMASTSNVNVPASAKVAEWVLLMDLGPADLCSVAKPYDWWLYDVRDDARGFYQRFSWGVAMFPNSYFEDGQDDPGWGILCWPTWHIRICNYACPAINSLQEVISFPGECGSWWSHTDEEGVYHTCGQ